MRPERLVECHRPRLGTMSEALNAEQELGDLRAENDRLRREVQAMTHLIDSLENLMEAVQEPRSDSEVMNLLGGILDDAMNTTDAEAGSLLVLDEDSDELVFVMTRGEGPAEESLLWRRLPRTEGIAGWVATNRHATIVNDVQDDDRFYNRFDLEFSFRTRSILAAPIIGSGRVLGVIEVVNKNSGAGFSAADQALLSLLCRFAGELLIVVMDRQQGTARGRLPRVS